MILKGAPNGVLLRQSRCWRIRKVAENAGLGGVSETWYIFALLQANVSSNFAALSSLNPPLSKQALSRKGNRKIWRFTQLRFGAEVLSVCNGVTQSCFFFAEDGNRSVYLCVVYV